MTNEEVFEKFFPKPMVFENKEHELTALSQWYDLQRGWKTAIAYMQEQNKSAEQSEPVMEIRLAINEILESGEKLPPKTRELVYFIKNVSGEILAQDPIAEVTKHGIFGIDRSTVFEVGHERGWQAAIAYMQEQNKSAEQSEALPPIEYDQEKDRWYIPMIGGWEIQTKGNGSTFRICNTKTNKRWPVLDKHLHEALEQMAKDNRHAYTPQRVEASDKTSLSGVVTRQLKRLSDEFKDNLYEKYWIKESMTFDELIEVVMDAMQELNK